MENKVTELKTYWLQNNGKLRIEVTNLGCRVMKLIYDGIDVVQGFESADEYMPERHLSDFGAVVGRYANRLAGGRITIEGKTIQLPQNNGLNCLHGGPRGWQYSIFAVENVTSNHIVFSLISPDGDNGFPGTVRTTVTYSLGDDDTLRIDYHAESDSTTVINLTNHSYFNLNGDLSSNVENHLLRIDADRYTPTDESAIPLGEHAAVDGTPFDFREGKPVGNDIRSPHPQLTIGRGYDHNFVLNKPSLSNPVASLKSPVTGIVMDVMTTAPGIQVYTGNFLDGVKGKNGACYARRSAICLETQQYPDSQNHKWPESTGYLYKDKPFKSTTIFKFSH